MSHSDRDEGLDRHSTQCQKCLRRLLALFLPVSGGTCMRVAALEPVLKWGFSLSLSQCHSNDYICNARL
eukprot:1153770-Pelagomonas_calceolata.AAC.5